MIPAGSVRTGFIRLRGRVSSAIRSSIEADEAQNNHCRHVRYRHHIQGRGHPKTVHQHAHQDSPDRTRNRADGKIEAQLRIDSGIFRTALDPQDLQQRVARADEKPRKEDKNRQQDSRGGGRRPQGSLDKAGAGAGDDSVPGHLLFTGRWDLSRNLDSLSAAPMAFPRVASDIQVFLNSKGVLPAVIENLP